MAEHLLGFEYKENKFQSMVDVAELKRHLTGITQFITDPDFPPDKDTVTDTRSFLSDLLKQVSEIGVIGELYNEIMDLALDLTVKKADCEDTRTHFEGIGYFFCHLKEDGVKERDIMTFLRQSFLDFACLYDLRQGNEALYGGLVEKFIHVLNNVKDESYLTLKFALPVVQECLTKAMGTSNHQVAQWIQMIKALIKHPTPQCLDAADRALQAKAKLLKWKEYPDDARETFVLLCRVSPADWLTEKEKERAFDRHSKLMSHFLSMLEKAKQRALIMDLMVPYALDCLESRVPNKCKLGQEVAGKTVFNAKKDKELIMLVIRRVTAALADETHEWNNSRDLNSLVENLVDNALNCVSDGRTFTVDEYNELIDLAKLCQTLDFVDPLTGGPHTIGFNLYHSVGFKVINWLQTMNEIKLAAPLVPGCLEMLDSDEDVVKMVAGDHLRMIARSYVPVLAPYMDVLLSKFVENEQSELLDAIMFTYEHNPGPMVDHFQSLFEHIDSGDASIHSEMIMVIQKVAKYQPYLFTEENVGVVMKEATEDVTHQVILLMTVEEIAKRRPEKIKLYLDDLMALDRWQTSSHSIINMMLQYYALQSKSGDDAQKIMDFMMKQVQTSSDQAAVLTAYNAIRLIGFKYRHTIEKYRATIEKLRDTAMVEHYRMCCVGIIDMLDGKSVDKISQELKSLQEEVADVEIRVTATEATVTEVKDTVQRQGDDLENVKNEVTEHGQRLDDVEETVEETVVKVEEIDGKTLSHAPFWSRDVSKLLNPEAQHDWRLLSSRLGYSNDDIRGWAQQADPCMAMLNEWYATHKTREATYAVLTALQDMNRSDAAIIVENAMKNAEAVVEDEEFEYASPPDVFISYQWSHQNEVRLLRQHLEMAGYSCWMDVGQMGGGDKLFEKIDSGIRAAKVVISCVTEKYAKSPNCNREVNLSVSLGKPIIPLLMEKTTWPPPGSMGPIFSEYLFIRFFQRVGEETSDQRYWPPDKFQELLMQLSMNGVTPDQDAVQPEYKDWWIPKIEEVIVDKNRAKGQNNSSAVTTVSDEKAASSPEVFISYQWGRQPQIVGLYRTLTSLGYTCWLDIMQMGGGDSLYDKIDRGLRGCRVVVSCVAPKYALSANCRREVSLADALRKPLIPILLETTSWPPPGPMGPILTQLLYIDCTSLQDDWTGPKFDELLSMINQHVPNMASASAEATAAVEEVSDGQDAAVLQSSTEAQPESNQDAAERNDTAEQASPSGEQDATGVRQSPEGREVNSPRPVSCVGEASAVEDSSSAQRVSPTQQWQSLDRRHPSQQSDEMKTPAEPQQSTGGENPSSQQEKKLADRVTSPATSKSRHRAASIASSTMSECGHDAHNQVNMLRSYGLESSQSACCSIL